MYWALTNVDMADPPVIVIASISVCVGRYMVSAQRYKVIRVTRAGVRIMVNGHVGTSVRTYVHYLTGVDRCTYAVSCVSLGVHSWCIGL